MKERRLFDCYRILPEGSEQLLFVRFVGVVPGQTGPGPDVGRDGDPGFLVGGGHLVSTAQCYLVT